MKKAGQLIRVDGILVTPTAAGAEEPDLTARVGLLQSHRRRQSRLSLDCTSWSMLVRAEPRGREVSSLC